jgi:PD-(D/E)XK nuclease superfamily
MTLMLDASAIKTWLDCREQYRLRYIENRVSAEPSYNQWIGTAIHLAAEIHNRGGSFESGLALAAGKLAEFPESLLNPYKRQRFRELAAELPSMVAAYFDGVEVGTVAAVEEEWSYDYLPGVTLCGRKDKVERDPAVLFDLKTASEIGRSWHADFKASMLRDFGLALYDWHECRMGRPPETIKIECLVKPYKGSECRLEIFDLPEITAYRKRFEQQLQWVVTEIAHYHLHYAQQQPWPMAQEQCITKYGACEYLQGCNQGWNPKILANYTSREEHLNVRKVNTHVEPVSKGAQNTSS